MRELRFAVRTLGRTPGFVLGAVVTMALGIGAATAIFSVVYGVLLRPLPYQDGDRLVVVDARQNFSGRELPVNFSPFAARPWRERARAFESISFVYADSQAMTKGGLTELVDVDVVTPGFFETLQGRFAAGRPFSAGENDAPVAVISYRTWQQTFEGSPSAVGQTIALDGHQFAVVGIAADSFRAYDPHAAVYVPAGQESIVKPGQFGANARSGGFNPIAKLRTGVTRAQATVEVDALIRALDAEFGRPRDVHASVVALRDSLVGGVRPALLLLFAAVGLVLLVACGNVANLMLARGAARGRDVAVRRALGASTWQLARQSLAESGLVAAAGAALGALLAVWLSRALVMLQADALPLASGVRIDLPVVAFAVAAAVGAALVAGVLPVFQGPGTVDALKVTAATTGGRRTRRARAALVAVELALSLVLLVGASLVGRSLLRLVHADVGVPTDHVAAILVDVARRGPADEAARQRIVADLVARIAATPGVVHAGIGTSVPPNRSRVRITMRGVPNGPTGDYAVDAAAVTPRFFSTLGIPLVRGRFFTDADDGEHAPVAIMTAATARELLGNDDPIGRTVEIPSTREGHVQAEVVGIVGDVKFTGLDAPAAGIVYRPFKQQSWAQFFVLARTAGDPAAMLPPLRRTIGDVDRTTLVMSTNTIDGFIADATAQPRFRSAVLTGLASLAVALAAVGLYGAVAYAVSQRTTEIGIRLALGATRGDVVGLVMKEAIGIAAVGVAGGIIVAIVGARGLSSMLYGIGPNDAASFVTSAAALAAVTLAAAYGPARRAARVDPVVALRDE